jgi:hypothetical protein
MKVVNHFNLAVPCLNHLKNFRDFAIDLRIYSGFEKPVRFSQFTQKTYQPWYLKSNDS